MKKIKDMLRRIGTAGLAATMLTAQMPVTAFAEEIEEPQAVVVSDEGIPAKVQMEDVLPIETDGDTAIAETDGFSLYTVEFTYDNKQYVLPGDSEVALSEILDTVGLTGEVSDVSVSDESLFSVKKCKTAEGGSIPEKDEDGNPIEDENGTWFVFAHQAFSTEEWMKVTIGGVMYEIMVTDSVSNVSYIDADGTTKTVDTVDVVDESMDNNTGLFVSNLGWLYVNNDVTLNGASNTGTIPINLILGDDKTLTLNNNAGLRFYYAPLTIYGQSSGTGKLSINGSNASYPMLCLGQNQSLTINSGTVEVTNNQNNYGTYAFGDKSLMMNGGSARFTARMGTAIYGDVTLNGGTFYASGEEGAVNGTVKVAEGKLYKDDAAPCNYYFGTLSNAQKAAINGKTLSPVNEAIHAVAISDVTRGTVTADKYTVATEATGEARTVTLTLAPETGYSLKILTVKDTSGNEVAVSGEGDTRTFTMPKDHVTVSAVFALPTVSTAYIDENGTEQTANAVALTGGGATTLDSGWYVVPENTTVSYTGTLKFDGDTHIILSDGATLNCGTESGRINVKSIEVNNGGLTVYGQRDQTGRLNAYSNNENTIFSQNSAVFNGGTVTADSVGFCAIMTNYSVTVRRGTVNAVSSAGQYNSNHTINAYEGVIVAGGALNVTAPDGNYAVTVSSGGRAVTLAGGTLSTTGGTGVVCYSYGSYVPATVKVADGMNYTDGANLYSGTLTDGQKAAIHGTTFTPAYGVIAAEGIEHGTVSASPAAFAIKDFADADKTVTLTVTPDENYTIGTVSYNDGSDHTITPVNGVYSFTMPEKDVTVNATFLKSLSHSDITIGSIAEQTYQGSGTTPSVTVKDGETTLTKDTDYTLSYSNNTNAAKSTATNAPTITITGKGSYSGTRTVNFTIKQKPVTVGGIKAKYKAYDATTSAALDCSGATFAGKVDGDRLTVSGTGTFDNKNAGKDKTVTISGLTLGGESKDNYVLAQSGHQTTTTATITRAMPEVTAPTASATYMENLSNVGLNNPEGNLSGTWTWATDNGINPNETSVGTVGTHVFRAKFTPTDTANYCEITKDVTVTVGKATPHLTIESFSAPYGHPVSVKSNCNSDGKVTYVFYKSDGKTKTNTEDGAETVGGPPKNAGTYNIVASVAETSNYLSWEETLLYGCEITPAPNPAVLRSTVTVKRRSDYDLSGLVSGAKGTVSFALKEPKDGYSLGGSTLTLDSNAADSCTITVTADGTVDGKSNYEIFSGEITVYATDLDPQDSFGFADVAQEKTYGDGDFTVAATGAETGSAVTYSSSDLAVATVEADTGKVHILKVGTATITATAVATDTYASAAASYKLTVNRKPVTISGIKANDLVYNPDIAYQGMTLNTASAVIAGKLEQDDLTVSAIGMCEADAGKNKTVTIRTITLGGNSKENYTVDLENSQKTTTINITKAAIPDTAITAPTGKNGLEYTGMGQSLVDAGTALGGEMRYALGTATTAPADNLYSASIPTGTNVGTYYVWYKVIGDTNHNDTEPKFVQVSVAKGPHSDQYANGSAKYGASGNVDLFAMIEEGGTVGTITKTDNDSVLNGEPIVTAGKLNFAFKDAADNADKTAVVTLPITSMNYENYNITVTLTVKAKEVPVLTVDPITKTYDGTSVTGAQIRGTAKVNGTEIKGTWKFEYDANFVDAADSGAKKVIFTPEDTATYDKAEAMLALKINKAVITIKAADKSIYVGDTVPSLYSHILGNDYTVTGLVGSDRLETAPTLSYSAAPDNTKAGSYTITPGGAAVPASGNYADTIVYQTGTLTIKAKSGGGSTGGGNTGGGGSSGGGGSTDDGGSSGGGNSGSGGSPSPVTPSENYTVPVSGENTVEVTAEITNGNAVINEISKSDIDRIIDSGSGSKSGEESIPITIDVSQAKSEVSSVELSAKTMERLTEAVNAENNVESVEIKLTNATVTLDGEALSAINEQAEGRSVTLAVEDTNTGDLNKAQQRSLKQFDSAKPFRAAFESDGKEIHDFKGGSVRVSLSFSPEKDRNARHYHIYYLPKTGAMERLLTYYTKGLLLFVTSHFSDYAIVYDQSIENGDPVEPENPEDPEEPAKTIEMHRLYNPNSGEHFYTGDAVEKDHLVELGWNYEGVAWNTPKESKIPVYRLYNPNAGDHHYTTDIAERDGLIKEGWSYEGIGWYSEESETVPLFRLYNPNALMAGAHHYTADAAERDHLIEIGWRDEKTGWYGALRMEAGTA